MVTGSAGFIGAAVAEKLLELGNFVIGLDCHNDYYDPRLKDARIARISKFANYKHIRIDLADRVELEATFKIFSPQRVVHLAAQAGVRYSIDNPQAYIDSNLVGFTNLIEGCRQNCVEHFVYASSSSVYGANTRLPFSVHDNVDHPMSLYAATKKSNELISHSYSHLFRLPTTGLRFFTVYGPWGRPDMSPMKFAKSITEGRPIQVFNYGRHRRDFTYIDDIVDGVLRVLDRPAAPNPNWDSSAPDPGSSTAPWRIYNIGNSQPVELLEYIGALERALGRVAVKEMLPMQPGDVPDTYADVSDLLVDFGYKPSTQLEVGIQRFADWYRSYYP